MISFFFLIVLAQSNFDHYTRECGFGILKKKKKKKFSQSNSFATPFGSTVMPPHGSESPLRVKAD